MQSRSVENESRAFERVLGEQMPAVLQASRSLHAAMSILPGTKMMDHQGETARRMSGAPALVTTSTLPSNPHGATKSGMWSAVLERDPGGEKSEDDEIEAERAAEEDDDGEDENEDENEAFNDSGFFEQVPTIMLQPPSPNPRIVGFGLEAVQSTRKRRTSEPLNWQPRQARKRLKTDAVEDGSGQQRKGATELDQRSAQSTASPLSYAASGHARLPRVYGDELATLPAASTGQQIDQRSHGAAQLGRPG
ncbi:hypothetical protein LTR53_005785 [Teratosphaeriaceae sp. CCFEE 6253]|nr:hypothetical protein LTR53_005785 [Teratosphaeriaceae sp. CCFEE 6253]